MNKQDKQGFSLSEFEPITFYRALPLGGKFLAISGFIVGGVYLSRQGQPELLAAFLGYVLGAWGKYKDTSEDLAQAIAGKTVVFEKDDGTTRTIRVDGAQLEGELIRAYCKIKEGYVMIRPSNIIKIVD